ncbi:hypothetical protein R7P65_10635 [Vibrio sp. Vb0718]|uniref:hypothetical protein n=1 Tax=Vibrio sp. Vb0718 TaxID=3074630 RepID=UPI0029640F14|nr:hypothetical protein [Vibrio sp. Vb0718]MDW1835726.1 hypothetical protein [Vibrio sp. Vb0718]
MKMLALTDGYTFKLTALASQKVGELSMHHGVYPYEFACHWITHGASRKAMLNPDNWRNDQITIGIVFDSTREREVKHHSLTPLMKTKLAASTFHRGSMPYMQLSLTRDIGRLDEVKGSTLTTDGIHKPEFDWEHFEARLEHTVEVILAQPPSKGL